MALGRKKFVVLTVLTCSLFLFGCRKVAGVVTDKATGQPLADVFIVMKADDQVLDTFSNPKGAWSIGKKSNNLGQYTAYKFGMEPFLFTVTSESKKDFWMSPNPQETIRRIMQLTKKSFSEGKEDLLNEVYNYLAIKDRALLQLPTFKQEMKKQETFYNMIDDTFTVKEPKVERDKLETLLQPVDMVSEQNNVLIKVPTYLDSWTNPIHRSTYAHVAQVTVELKKSTGGTVQVQYYLVQADDYWHYFWTPIS